MDEQEIKRIVDDLSRRVDGLEKTVGVIVEASRKLQATVFTLATSSV